MRRCRILFVQFMVAVLLSLSLRTAQAQRSNAVPQEGLLNVTPSAMMAQVEALGDRILRSEKGRTAFTGNFVNDRGEAGTLRVTVQLPRAVALEGLRPNAPAIVFDGRSSPGPVSKTEGDLLELFSSDTAEGLLAAVKEERAIRLLGRWVRDVPSNRTETVGPPYDIYEAAVDVPSNPTAPERLKRYLFDSETGLLARTEYLDEAYSPPLKVEVRFSDWQQIDGSAYPGRIVRLENDHAVFSLSVTRIQSLPREDPAHFGTAQETGRQEDR